MSNTSALIDELFKCVEAIGYEETYILLQKGQHPDTEFSEPKVKFIVESVSKKMGVSVNEIMYGNGRKNERKMAIGFCCYYLRELAGMDMAVIAGMLNKNYVVCYDSAKKVKGLNKDHSSDKNFVEIKEELDKIISKYLKKK